MLIQTTIVALEWKKEDGFQHAYQGVSLLIHGLVLIYDLTDNYFFQVTGKGQEEYSSSKKVLRTVFFNIFHLPARICIFSFILMYGRTAFLVSVGVLLYVCNLINAFVTLRTKAYKNLFTAASSIVMPSSIFFSRDTFKSRRDTEEKFRLFSIWNSIIFLVVVTLALIVMSGLHIFNSEFFEFNCDNLPPFTYSSHCNQNSLIYEAFGEDFPGHPDGGYLWASLFAWLLAAAQTLATILEAKCF